MKEADELDALVPADCDRQEPVPPCSALGRIARDYDDLVRAIEKGKEALE